MLTLSYWVLVEQRQWFLGGIGIAFSLAGLVTFGLMMRPGATYIRLDTSGFEVSALHRNYRYEWSEVDAFALATLRDTQIVAILFNPSCTKQQVGRAIAEGLAGIQGGLANVYALPPAEVCRVLNEWKAAHTEQQTERSEPRDA